MEGLHISDSSDILPIYRVLVVVVESPDFFPFDYAPCSPATLILAFA